MFTTKVPKAFWGEALHTTTYLVNRSPNRVLDLKCPEEVWSEKPPDLSRLMIFGCAAYVHNKEGKLDRRAVNCVFFGYQDQFETKGYKL